MNKKTLMIVGGVVVVLVIAGVANRYFSKSAAENVIEAATGGKANVDTGSGNVTVKTDQGTWSTGDKLPDDFPKDVPVYPDATVQSSVAATQEQGGGIFVGLETTDALDTVIAWYKREAAAQGWTIGTNILSADSLMLSGTKDIRELVVTITKDGGKVSIGLVVTQK